MPSGSGGSFPLTRGLRFPVPFLFVPLPPPLSFLDPSPAKNQRPEPVVGSSWELVLTLWAFLSSSPAEVDALLDESVVKVFE